MASMRLSGFDLNLLAVFEALMEEGSVTGAARRLGLGQPAASAALGRLRRAFGDELFLRTTEGMRPTPRAKDLAPGITAALAQFRRTLEAGAAFAPATATARFSIASTDYTTSVLLPGLLGRLRREAPRVDLRVIGYEKDDVASLLERGEIDAALGVFPSPPQRAVVTPLYQERFVGIARAGHPALRRGRVGLDAFCDWPHALVTTRRDAAGAVDGALAAVGRRRRVAATLPHMLALLPVVAASDLLAAVPARLMARTAPADRLRAFPLPVEVAGWGVVMLWPAAARGDRGGAWLRAAVRAVAAGV